MFAKSTFSLTVLLLLQVSLSQSPAAEPDLAALRRDTGFTSGLAAVVGATDAGVAAALAGDGQSVVQVINTEPAQTEAIRRGLTAKGLYGLASADAVESFSRLPYADNMINLLVADLDLLASKGLKKAEVLRVVAPESMAYLKEGGAWKATRKPLPAGMDVWPHWDYDSGGNPINRDSALELVTSLRWMAGPSVFEGGHGADIGYRINEGLAVYSERGSKDTLEGKRMDGFWLVGRDAHNGVLRWRVPLSPNHGFPNRHAVILAGGRVYANLLPGEPMVALDARTGKVALTFDRGARVTPVEKLAYGFGTRNHPSYHLVARLIDGKLLQAHDKTLYCLDATTGALLWKRENPGHFVNWILAGEGGVFAAESVKPIENFRGSFAFWLDRLVALDLATGKESWSKPDFAGRAAHRLVYHAGALMIPHFGPDTAEKKKDKVPAGELNKGYRQEYLVACLDAKTGQERWQTKEGQKASAHYQVAMVQEDRFHVVGQDGFAISMKDGGKLFNYNFAPFDGCGDPRGTPRWMFYTMSFAQFSDEKTLINPGGKYQNKGFYRINNRGMARSTCDTGVFPAYASVYTSPALCGCNDYLTGYNSFTAAALPPAIPDEQRLRAGPAAGSGTKPAIWPAANEWPIHMGNPARGSHTTAEGPAALKELWRTPPTKFPAGTLGAEWSEDERADGPLTPATVGEGLVFTALRYQHKLVALEATTGKERWSFTAGARLDSPPTVYGGLCIFGSHDGRIYALRAKDGALVWTFFAAHSDRRIVDDSYLESSWPVSGSVLIQNHGLYAVAGRHSSIDGGLKVWKLDPLTGKILGSARVDTNPEKMEPTNKTNYGGNRRAQDLLVGSGKFIHHRYETIDPDLKNPIIETVKSTNPGNATDTDLAKTDRPWIFARQYFLSCRRPGFGRYFTSELTYPAEGKNKVTGFVMGLNEDRLIAVSQKGEVSAYQLNAQKAPSGTDAKAGEKPLWKQNSSQPDAIALAGARIYLATVKSELSILNLTDGTSIGKMTLPARVHKNGLAVAGGRVFATLEDGTVICLGE